MARDRFVRQSLGAVNVKQSRVLLVGAGGIGCELLKNLVLTGFGEIHVVDLDTIDLSNLNRQFLFRHEHIKKSKALVAKESAAKFNPNVKIEAHHDSIKESRFNTEWFHGFDIVFNALDNLDARRHVNRMCLAAGVPLIESGTTGFDGQVQVIVKGQSECYDCNTKEVPKTFPVCTIRSTPSQAIHCIVWAKNYLFTEIFGTSEEETPVLDYSEDSENAQEIENLRREAAALKNIRESMGRTDFARNLFQKVFKDDILRLRSMEDMWKTRKAPNRLDYDTISKAAADFDASLAKEDQRTWNEVENFIVFSDSLRRLSDRMRALQVAPFEESKTPEILSFDKDDEDTLDFVTSSANLRSIIFGIEPKTKFDVKQMAGNIIPAIATTNAMTAGLCVLQAIKVLKGNLDKAKMIFLERSTSRVISSEKLQPPKADCPVCSVAQAQLLIDPTRGTLKDLVESVLRPRLGYEEGFSINNEVGTLYDPDLEDNLDKTFDEVGVKADSFLTVVDESDENPYVNLSLAVAVVSLPSDATAVQITGKLDVPRKPKVEHAPQTNGHSNGMSDVAGAGSKRKRSAEEAVDAPQVPKKGKVLGAEDDTVIIDDSNDGAIIIED